MANSSVVTKGHKASLIKYRLLAPIAPPLSDEGPLVCLLKDFPVR